MAATSVLSSNRTDLLIHSGCISMSHFAAKYATVQKEKE